MQRATTAEIHLLRGRWSGCGCGRDRRRQCRGGRSSRRRGGQRYARWTSRRLTVEPSDRRQRTAAAAERIRSGRRARGVEALFAPGEPEWRRREHSAGEVMLAPAVAAMLVRYAQELKVSAHPLDASLDHLRKETGDAQA